MAIGVMQFGPMVDPLKRALETYSQLGQEQEAKMRREALPKQIQANLQSQEAMNQLRQMQAKKQEQQAQLPGGGAPLTGAAGQVQGLESLKHQFGEQSPQYRLAQNIMESQMSRGRARQWTSMPAEFRAQQLARAAAAGIDSNTANQAFMRGQSLDDLVNDERQRGGEKSEAHQHGQTQALASALSGDKLPQYPVQKAALAQSQKQAQASAGLNVMNKFIADNGVGYGGPIDNLTKKWYRDAIMGNPKEQDRAVNYLAAHTLTPEIAGLRMRMQGGAGGIGAIRDIGEKILGNIQINLANYPPEIQKRVQNTAEKILEDAVNAEGRQALSRQPSITPSESPNEERLQHTMKKYNLSREQVLSELKKAGK